jgi:hypothetical protein
VRTPRVRFTPDELAAIAHWEPIADGFGQDPSTVQTRIQPIVDTLRSNRSLSCSVVQNGGTANYFAFTVYPTPGPWPLL